MRRFLSALTGLMVMLSCLSAFCFAATSISMNVQPAVFLCGNIYNIVWSTNIVGTGRVEYTYNNKDYTVYDEKAGVVRTDDYIHSVSVPIEHLDGAGAYTIVSTAVDSRTPYSISYGGSCSVSRTFTGYHNQSQINIWTASDIHRTTSSTIMTAVTAASSYLQGGNPDLIMLLGDIGTAMQTKSDAEICIFDTAAKMSGGTIPCVYTRGNHETRGAFSGYLLEYLPSDTGEFYFTFEYGPMSSVVLDFGEDKIDSHPEYSGLVDYNNYRVEENDWLNTVESYTGNPTYRIAFCHGPNIKDHFGYNWLSNLSSIGTDLLVAGHYHSVAMWSPGGTNSSSCTDFPIMLDGSHIDDTGYNISQLLLNNGNITCNSYSNTGTQNLSYVITAGQNLKSSGLLGASAQSDSTDVAQDTEDAIPTAYGASIAQLLKGASPDFGFITKPVVFDTGDTYTVAWATTEGKNSHGEVYLTYEGQERRFTDSEGGTLRCLSNMHAVRIPKKYLENNSYTVISQQIITHGAYSATKGNTVTTGYLDFEGYSDQSEINMLTVSDLNSDLSLISKIRAASGTVDMVILDGNIMKYIDSSSDIINGLLYSAGMLTGGKIPVAFVRGENEILGEYSPYLTRVVRNSTRQFYEAVEYGPVSMLLLDTAGLYSDESPQYNQLASFEPVRQKQMQWLQDQSYGDATYKLAFAHSPVIHNLQGYKYSSTLNTLGTDLAVFAHEGTSASYDIGLHNQNFVSFINGNYAVDQTVATKLTFSGGNITVRALNENGTTKLTKTLSVTDNDETLFMDVSSTSWYASAVGYASNQQLMLGISADDFAPDDILTRGMAVTVLARLADADLTQYTQNSFKDVVSGSYYQEAVCWAQATGITNGISESSFAPDASISREQLCTMIYRMYKDKLPSNSTCGFNDNGDISAYAKDAVCALYNAGIINGMGNNTFMPALSVTRAMMAQILYKAKF